MHSTFSNSGQLLDLPKLALDLYRLANSTEKLAAKESPIQPVTIESFCEMYPDISENRVRNWIRSNPSGFSRVHKKIGKLIYIDNAKFIEWFKEL